MRRESVRLQQQTGWEGDVREKAEGLSLGDGKSGRGRGQEQASKGK